MWRSTWSAEQHADLVAAQRAVAAVAVGDRGAEPIGVGIVRDQHVRLARAPPRRARGRARRAPPGWGRPPSGSRDRDRPARATTCSGGKPGSRQHTDDLIAPDAVHRACTRSTRRAPTARATARPRRDWKASITSLPSRVTTRDRRATRAAPSTSGPTASIAAEISVVGRRHDLRAVAEVHLVPVVGRWVVARGHHHARGATEMAHGEREQRRRQPRRQQQRARSPPRRSTAARVLREHVGLVPRVAPDDDAGLGRARHPVEQIRARAPPRRAARSPGSCGSVRRRARRAARPCRTAAARRSDRQSASSVARSEQRCELGPCVGIGIFLEPAGRGRDEVCRSRQECGEATSRDEVRSG